MYMYIYIYIYIYIYRLRLRLAERLAGRPKEGTPRFPPPPGTSPPLWDWGGGWEESDPDSYHPLTAIRGDRKRPVPCRNTSALALCLNRRTRHTSSPRALQLRLRPSEKWQTLS